jgi:hypothetical protein
MQGGFGEGSGNVKGGFGEHAGNIQGTFRDHFGGGRQDARHGHQQEES